MSAAHISRFLRSLIESPPAPETIAKLADKAWDEVTYKELMTAAGHIVGSNEDEGEEDINSPRNRMRQIRDLEKKFVQVFLSELYEMPFKWSVEKNIKDRHMVDLEIEVEEENFKRWLVEFRGIINDSKRPLGIGMQVPQMYGRIALMDLRETDKMIIALNNEFLFERFLDRPPLSLRANIFVMLMDLEEGKILREEQICKY